MRIALTGDLMLGRRVAHVIEEHSVEHVWGDVLPLLRSADSCIVNLECVIAYGQSHQPWMPPKAFYFIAGPRTIHVLKTASIEAVTLANNHTLDYGGAALVEMLDLLADAGIKYVGAGRNDEEAQSPLLFEVRGLTLAVINFTDNEPAWEATEVRPGVFYVPIDLQDHRFWRLQGLLHEVRRAADVVLVNAHWGPNMIDRPLTNHPPFARALLDAGADCVAGHSAHVFQGIEIYHGKPVLYDMGDFITDYAVDPTLRNDRSFLWELDVDKGGVKRIELTPVVLDGRGCQANRARGAVAQAAIEKMVRLCSEMGTQVTTQDDRMTVHLRTGSSVDPLATA